MNLQIGLTDQCDFRCIMCMQTAHKGLYGTVDNKVPPLHDGKKGFINPELFRKILEQTSDIHFDTVKLQWLGESLIHPNIKEIISIFSEYSNYRRVVFTTNLNRISHELLNLISGLQNEVQIVVSLDSVKRDIYEKIKGVRRFANVMSNVEKLLEYSDIIKTFQAIVMEENLESSRDFLDYFRERGVEKVLFDEEDIYLSCSDHVYFKRLGAFDQKRADSMHKDIYRRITGQNDNPIKMSCAVSDPSDPKRTPCPAPFRTVTFNWDGRLTYCCMDSELELSPGNIRDASFDELWFGDFSERLRQDMVDRRFSDHARCRRCGNLPVRHLTEKERERYAENTFHIY